MTKLSEIPDGQAIRLFNGAVDATNYERGYMRWASNVFEIGAEKGGTGTQRIGRFCIDGAGNVIEGVSGQNQVRIICGGSVSMDIDVGIWSAGSGEAVAVRELSAPMPVAETSTATLIQSPSHLALELETVPLAMSAPRLRQSDHPEHRYKYWSRSALTM